MQYHLKFSVDVVLTSIINILRMKEVRPSIKRFLDLYYRRVAKRGFREFRGKSPRVSYGTRPFLLMQFIWRNRSSQNPGWAPETRNEQFLLEWA